MIGAGIFLTTNLGQLVAVVGGNPSLVPSLVTLFPPLPAAAR